MIETLLLALALSLAVESFAVLVLFRSQRRLNEIQGKFNQAAAEGFQRHDDAIKALEERIKV